MSTVDHYAEFFARNHATAAAWTEEERNQYRCAKLKVANKAANGSYTVALCTLIGVIAICYFLSNIAFAITKLRMK